MTEPFDPSSDSLAWVADTGLFIACGRQKNDKYTALERFTRRHDVTFVIPRRVYEELGGAPADSTPGQTPVDAAIDSGWVSVADDPTYTDSSVARVMDDTRTRIARASNRAEDQIEKADTALAAVAVELLAGDGPTHVRVVMTDHDAGEAVVAALSANGFENRVEFTDGFAFIDRLDA